MLREVERAANQLFRTTPYPEIATWEPLDRALLAEAQQAGLLWALVDATDQPVGLAMVKIVDGLAHLHELDVHPAHGRRGLGRRLVAHVCAWAATHGYPAVTLLTFRYIPWNGPLYAQMGFQVVDDRTLSAGLWALRQAEAAHGLDIQQRVCMRRELTQGAVQAYGARRA